MSTYGGDSYFEEFEADDENQSSPQLPIQSAVEIGLKAEIERLNKDLETERKKHELSKAKFENIIEGLKEELQSKEEQLKIQKEEIVQNNTDPSPSTLFHPSLKLRQEFFKFCTKFNMDDIPDENDMTEEFFISALRYSIKRGREKSTRSSADLTGGSLLQPAQEAQLLSRIKNLEYELRLALGAAEDIRALKDKLKQMVERNRTEKESKLKLEQELLVNKKKMEMLSNHIEKLMTHLKHESVCKIRALEAGRNSEKNNEKLAEKYDALLRKNAATDRLVAELQEGSKILEDQLQLMDEKYLELRTKLEYARESGTKKLKKALKTAADLRLKFALAGNNLPLDCVPLPALSTGGSNRSSGVSGSSPSPEGFSNDIGGSRSFGGRSGFGMYGGNGGGGGGENSPGGMGTGNDLASRGGGGGGGGGAGSRKGIRTAKSEPTLEKVLDKIRVQEAGKKDWTEDKARELLKNY